VAALQASGRFEPSEIAGTRRVLTAAAMTYVAALAVSVAQVLRLLIRVAQIVGRSRD
jgi:Zn-dependent membrane protease YugP